MLRLLTFSVLIVSTAAFLFGNSCGCGLPPLCLPMPSCPPAPACTPMSSCGGGGGGYVQPPPAFPPPSFQPPSYVAPPLPQSPVYQPGQVLEQPPLPQQQQQQVPSYTSPIVSQPAQVESSGQAAVQNIRPQEAPYQAPVAAQRDDEPRELVNSLHQEAAAAAGQTNEEVVEDQDRALENSETDFTTILPTASSTGFPEAAEEKVVDIATLNLTDDPLCNSEDLRKLMLENIDENLNSSKRLIQLAAEAQFGGRFDVICANGDFSYVTNTELFCQETKGDISCYTYRQL